MTAAGRPDDPVDSRIVEARTAFDQLDFARGRERLDDAERLAAEERDPSRRIASLARVSAACYQLGITGAGRSTLGRLTADDPNAITEVPVDVIIGFAATDALRPVLVWLSAQPSGSPGVGEVARALARTIDDRILHRETGELVIHGGDADPGAPDDPARERRTAIRKSIQAGENVPVDRLRENENAAERGHFDEMSARVCLDVARALLWHRFVPNGGRASRSWQ
jgi:hypothetical protein